MGISKLTAIVVGSNYPDNIRCEGVGSKEEKFCGIVYLLRGDGNVHNIQISTSPAFKTADEAKAKMEELCEELKRDYGTA